MYHIKKHSCIIIIYIYIPIIIIIIITFIKPLLYNITGQLLGKFEKNHICTKIKTFFN